MHGMCGSAVSDGVENRRSRVRLQAVTLHIAWLACPSMRRKEVTRAVMVSRRMHVQCTSGVAVATREQASKIKDRARILMRATLHGSEGRVVTQQTLDGELVEISQFACNFDCG